MSQVASICQLVCVCVDVTQTLEKKRKIKWFTRVNYFILSEWDWKKEIICSSYRNEKKNFENNWICRLVCLWRVKSFSSSILFNITNGYISLQQAQRREMKRKKN